MGVILRSNLGRKLTFSEMDENFNHLSSNPNILNNKREWVWMKGSHSVYIPVMLDKSDKSILVGIRGDNGKLVKFPTLRAYPVLKFVYLYDNTFPEDVVNQILVDVDENGNMNGVIELHGGLSASPSGDGVTAKNSLMNKNWTIITN